jgi:hypothetical protein
MMDETDPPRAFEELIALRGGATRPVTRFGHSGRRKPLLGTRRGPTPDPRPAAADFPWQREDEPEASRVGRDASG